MANKKFSNNKTKNKTSAKKNSFKKNNKFASGETNIKDKGKFSKKASAVTIDNSNLNDPSLKEMSKLDRAKLKEIMHPDLRSEKRINKYISETGFCSRREADRLVADKKVRINNVTAVMGSTVSEGDIVTVNGRRLKTEDDLVYIALNKPVGITCTTEHKVRGNIVDFVNHEKRIFPIGRLDKDSNGLILLTNDGDIVNKILRAGNNHEKEYIVTVDKPVTDSFIKGMSSGVPILGTVTNECKVQRISKYSFNIILTQGLNRQIRRMAEHFGFTVTKLKRIRIMNINLEGIKEGQYRDLTPKELADLTRLIQTSKKTVDE